LSARRWLLVGLLTVGVFAGLLAYGDFRQVGRTLFESPAAYAGLAAAAGLAVVNYGLRFLRWWMYLRALELNVPVSVSVPVFVAGLALSITPGKVGELLKSVWLHQRAGVPVATSAPAVVMERLTDVISVALLGMTGALLLPPAVALAIGALLVIGLAVGLLAASRYGARALDLPLLRRWREPLAQSQGGLRRLMSPRLLLAAVALGFLAWAAEGLALWVIALSLGDEVAVGIALPISAAAALLGAMTALPGGLVGFEGSMVALLGQAGLPAATAALATLLTRLATLWLAVIVGGLAWLWLARSGRRQATALASDPGDARGS
jgi:uncharacterized protein (TIRG00374 family)